MDIDSVYLHDFEIYVDILKQQEIMSKPKYEEVTEAPAIYDILMTKSLDEFYNSLVGSKTVISMPTMPLNTDGIDPQGSNVTIRNVNITNYDDAVAVKPANRGMKIAKNGCS